MKRSLLLPAFLIASLSLNAQTVVDFDSYLSGTDTFANGSNGDTTFIINDFNFPVDYDTTFNFWSSGFAVSNRTDTSEGSFLNLYSAYTVAPDPTNGYMVANLGGGPVTIDFMLDFPATVTYSWHSVDVTNTTYAFKSMLNGDLFAKQFGGSTGDDPDYFFIRFSNGGEPVDFYLADYRSSNNAEDYIIDDWTTVDLSSLVGNKFLTIELFSSDTGMFGINTPLFFGLDNLGYTTNNTIGISSIDQNDWKCWSDGSSIRIETDQAGWLVLHDVQGRTLWQGNVDRSMILPLEAQEQIIIARWQTAQDMGAVKLLH